MVLASTQRITYLPIFLDWARYVIMRWDKTVSHPGQMSLKIHVP